MRAAVPYMMEGGSNMTQVVSQDGTPIAYERTGTGPPLVLVHGTGVDHTYWDLLIPGLAREFTVYAMDRRGRGQSGDTPPYAIQREFHDIAALVDTLPGAVNVLGHSYGALCALEAALLTSRIHKLALYEPPLSTTVDVSVPSDTLDRFDAFLNAGKAEAALLLLHAVGRTPADELHVLRSLPSWQARVLAAPTIPREVLAVRDYRFDPGRFRQLRTSVRLLLGSETLPVYQAATQPLHGSLPQSRIVVLPGQAHDAALTAPALVVREVIGYLLADR
jgi:pimeloyl-ACP methyl ester carboxylesterase